MKKIAMIALAGTALAAAPATAAGTHTTSSIEFSNPFLTEYGGIFSPADASNLFDFVQSGGGVSFSNYPINGSGSFTHATIGSRYRQSTSAPDDTETASNTGGGAFTLKGTISADCSFYNGASADHTVDLGMIGVRTGDADNVTVAFNQAGAATAHVDTATAGCNTHNSVTIAEANQGQGLVNAAPGAYDSTQFTAHIPYTVTASWTGVENTTRDGFAQSLTVAQGVASNSKFGGAWRSALNMDITIPAQPLGLVAGQYQDRITVTLAVS